MKRIRRLGRYDIIGFLLPGGFIILLVLLFPLLYTFRMGLFSFSLSRGMNFVGLRNYINIFSDPKFHVAFRNTIVYTSVVVIVEMIVGFILANILNHEYPFRNFFRGLLMVPMLTSRIVAGIIWRFMFNPDFGIINYFFTQIGLRPRVWTGRPETALLSVMIVDVWMFTPFVILLFLAGLQSIPKEQYEAASIDGANRIQSLLFITIPHLTPMILVVLLLRTMDSLKVFDQVYSLTAGGPGISSTTMGVYAYTEGFRRFSLGYASAMSWILALIIIIFSGLYVRILSISDREGE